MAVTRSSVRARRVLVSVALLMAWTSWAGLPASRAAPSPGPEGITDVSVDGAWFELSPWRRSSASAIHHPLRDRMLIFGGLSAVPTNDVLVLPLGGGNLTRLATTGTPPPSRSEHTAIYDPVRDRMIIFGGTNGTSKLNDVWALTLAGTPQWTELAPSGTPPSVRAQHTAIYDPVRDRMVVYGGVGASPQAFVLDLATNQWSVLPVTLFAATGHTAIYDPNGDRMLVSFTNSAVYALTFGATPTWSELDGGTRPPSRQRATAIYDAARARMVIFGGFGGSYLNDTHVLRLAGTPAWGQHIPSGPLPPGRSAHVAIYDPARNQMVVFGGIDASGVRSDVWKLPLDATPEWQTVTPAGTLPPPRTNHSMIYDPVRDRFLMFGGLGNDVDHPGSNQLWSLSLSGTPAWVEVPTVGAPGRYGHSAIYDPVRDRMIIFGGGTHCCSVNNETWALSLAGVPTWTQIVASGDGPPEMSGHDAVYDPVRDRMIVFGGAYNGPTAYALDLAPTPTWSAIATAPSEAVMTVASYDAPRDRILSRAYCYCPQMWQLPLGGTPSWEPVTTEGTTVGGPSQAAARDFYDPASDRLIVYDGNQLQTGALTLEGTPTWGPVGVVGSISVRLENFTAVLDPVRHQIVVFGGNNAFPGDEYIPHNEVWVASLTQPSSWISAPAAPAPVLPDKRWSHSAVYDGPRQRMILFGGYDGTSYRNDLWEYSLAGDGAWHPLTASGGPPSPRAHHTAIFDPARDRMLLFGGHDGASALGDVWELSLGGSPQWTEMTPAGSAPSPRMLHTAIYDELRDRMVVFGGFTPTYLNDVYALNLAGTPRWEALTPLGTLPAGRFGHSTIFDLQRDRMLVFGGYSQSQSLNDVWELGLGPVPLWTQLSPTGMAPVPRSQHMCIYDPVRDRMLVLGGGTPPWTLLYSDVWALSLAGVPAWSMLSPAGASPAGRRLARAVYDSSNDRLVFAAGWSGAYQADAWSLSFTKQPPLVVPAPGVPRHLWLAPGFPNPTRSALSLLFGIPTSGPASIRIYDLAGRLIRTVREGAIAAGTHRVQWDGKKNDGARVTPGVYLYELRAGPERKTGRAVVLK